MTRLLISTVQFVSICRFDTEEGQVQEYISVLIAAQLWRQAEYVRELGGHPADIQAAMVSVINTITYDW